MFGPAAIHMAHRWVAAIVGVVVLAACWQAWRHRREAEGLGPLALITAVVLVAQVLVGAANPLSGFSVFVTPPLLSGMTMTTGPICRASIIFPAISVTRA